MAVILFFKILSTSDISETFAFYNGLTKGSEVLLEDDNIELILCNTTLPDGSGLDLLHSQRHLAERYGALVKSRPFFILTDSRDLATEYQYRQEGVNDYLTPPVNIPELIRRICYFVNR